MAEEKREVVIEASEDGPYLVKVDGNIICALCRCGQSNDKPYCDGTHKKVGFKAKKKEIKV
jgi:CDGSH-type Zn-finger protein